MAKPTAAVRGRPSASSTQRSATASIAAAAGELTRLKAFWSHAEVSQSAAERGRQRAARDEAEVARTRVGDDAGPGRGHEVLEHRDVVLALLGQRLVERGDHVLVGGVRSDRAVTKRREVLLGELGGAAHHGHRRSLSGGSSASPPGAPTATGSTRRRAP